MQRSLMLLLCISCMKRRRDGLLYVGGMICVLEAAVTQGEKASFWVGWQPMAGGFVDRCRMSHVAIAH